MIQAAACQALNMSWQVVSKCTIITSSDCFYCSLYCSMFSFRYEDKNIVSLLFSRTLSNSIFNYKSYGGCCFKKFQKKKSTIVSTVICLLELKLTLSSTIRNVHTVYRSYCKAVGNRIHIFQKFHEVNCQKEKRGKKSPLQRPIPVPQNS